MYQFINLYAGVSVQRTIMSDREQFWMDIIPNPLGEMMSNPQRALVGLLYRYKDGVAIETLSLIAEITVSGARQHASKLERDGMVTYQRQKQGPGRPRHLYILTERGRAQVRALRDIDAAEMKAQKNRKRSRSIVSIAS